MKVGFKNITAIYSEGSNKQLISPKPMPVILERDLSTGELTVRVSVSGGKNRKTKNPLPGEAEQNADYDEPGSGRIKYDLVTLPDGIKKIEYDFKPLEDKLFEEWGELVILKLSNPSLESCSISQDTCYTIILDNDWLPETVGDGVNGMNAVYSTGNYQAVRIEPVNFTGQTYRSTIDDLKVIWTGLVQFPAIDDFYTFHVVSTGAYRLNVNGIEAIAETRKSHTREEKSWKMNYKIGNQLNYFELEYTPNESKTMEIQLFYSSSGTSKQLIPPEFMKNSSF